MIAEILTVLYVPTKIFSFRGSRFFRCQMPASSVERIPKRRFKTLKVRVKLATRASEGTKTNHLAPFITTDRPALPADWVTGLWGRERCTRISGILLASCLANQQWQRKKGRLFAKRWPFLPFGGDRVTNEKLQHARRLLRTYRVSRAKKRPKTIEFL